MTGIPRSEWREKVSEECKKFANEKIKEGYTYAKIIDVQIPKGQDILFELGVEEMPVEFQEYALQNARIFWKKEGFVEL